MKTSISEIIHDVAWSIVTLVTMVILSIPLALGIFAALPLLLLPEAVGHLSWTHLIFQLEQFKHVSPHALFFFVREVFITAWGIAFITKLMTLPDDKNLLIQQRRIRERRRNALSKTAVCKTVSVVHDMDLAKELRS